MKATKIKVQEVVKIDSSRSYHMEEEVQDRDETQVSHCSRGRSEHGVGDVKSVATIERTRLGEQSNEDSAKEIKRNDEREREKRSSRVKEEKGETE